MKSFEFAPIAERLFEEIYRLLAALPLLLVALVMVLAAGYLGGWLSRSAAVRRLSRSNPFLTDLTRTTVRWLVTALGVLAALELLNATAMVGAVLGTAGILGVALGFAFKEILENYLAGILMSVRQPFALRDHVVIDGNEGTVVALTSRATILMTPDGNHLRLPNAMVFRGVTLNYTRNPSRRFEFDVGIGVEEDLLLAQDIGVREMALIEGVMASPPPRAFIDSLGDSNVAVRFQGWVDQGSNDFALVKSEAIRRVKLALEAGGMDMPEPIYRVQLREPPAAGPKPAKPPAAPAAIVADTRATAHLAAQIHRDRQHHGGENLLDPNAPRE
ncbi:MAG: mechanosensitive ion channel family protein [Arenimonas sp.]|uniref:mechanosensitive ion channel family protein n=1 Tax=Arenimonas sp. TaxID=1872635 RepID=UPI0025BAAB5A|nr:mechanosensitive ion channel family protein [Arenimonas sp.]MBW8366388.1 mechanosensitive ion channel family protein [Arenimonas sp.]